MLEEVGYLPGWVGSQILARTGGVSWNPNRAASYHRLLSYRRDRRARAIASIKHCISTVHGAWIISNKQPDIVQITWRGRRRAVPTAPGIEAFSHSSDPYNIKEKAPMGACDQAVQPIEHRGFPLPAESMATTHRSSSSVKNILCQP